MRTWGRTTDEFGNKTWVEVVTDANGYNDAVYVTTLIQVLKLNLGESPFFGQFGIPAKPAVIQQVYPDYYVAFTQQYFSTFFASVIVATVAGVTDSFGHPVPTYRVNVVTQYGSILSYEFSNEVPV